MRTDIKTELKGRWSSVLQSIGFPVESLNGKHQACVFCGGKDRSRYDKAKEVLFCNGCGHRYGVEIAMEYLNLSYGETAQHLRPNLRNYKMETVKAPDIEKNKAKLQAILKGCVRISPDNLAGKYFAKRGITATPTHDCFFNPVVDYWQDGVMTALPAIVSRVRDPSGEISTFHITYLGPDGKKANVESPRKILPIIAPMQSGAVRLFEATNTVIIAEGIESALSAHMDCGLPAWAAINAGNMAALVIPESIKHVYIFADSDESMTGQSAAYTLARRLKVAGGRETVKVILLIDQQQVIDSGQKYDINDYIIMQAAV